MKTTGNKSSRKAGGIKSEQGRKRATLHLVSTQLEKPQKKPKKKQLQ